MLCPLMTLATEGVSSSPGPTGQQANRPTTGHQKREKPHSEGLTKTHTIIHRKTGTE
jgi:hypothetical protein